MRWLCAACVVFASASARADDATVAQQLYDKAKQLEADGKLREACTAFAASFKADPQLGVLLNLADCHEKIGKLASAWSEFREAVNRANRISDAREAYARKRADALAPRLAKLHVVPPAAGTTVTLDGADVTALVGTDMPIDSGAHELTASAPGRAKQTKHVTIADTAATTTVEIAPDKTDDKQPAGPSGSLSIVASRDDAEISIDGTTCGVGSCTRTLPVGGHTLRATAPGARAYQTEVFVGDGPTRTIEVPLETDERPPPPMPLFRRHVRLVAFAGSGFVGGAHQDFGLQSGRAGVTGAPIVIAAGARYALARWADAQARLGFTYLPDSTPSVDVCTGTGTGTTSVSYLGAEATVRFRPASGLLHLGVGLAIDLENYGGNGSVMYTNCGPSHVNGTFTVDTADHVLIGSALVEFGFVLGAREQWELGVSARLGILGGIDKIQALDQGRFIFTLGYAFY